MEKLFQRLKTEWNPATDYTSMAEANRDISAYLMGYYNWEKTHRNKGGISPANQFNLPSGIS